MSSANIICNRIIEFFLLSILSPYELDSLAATYPALDLSPLTSQEEQVLLSRLRGLDVGACAAAAGMSKKKAQALLDSEKGRVILDYAIKECRNVVAVDRDLLSTMLFEAHDLAATSGEKISAIRELGQLHDLYPNKKAAPTTIINNTANITTAKQLEQLDDAALLQIAGMDITPQPLPVATDGVKDKTPDLGEAIEAEFTEIEGDNGGS